MESQDLKATYRKIFKAKLTKIYDSNKTYMLDYKLQKNLKIQLDSILRFHKLRSKRPINLLFYYPLTLEFDIRKILRFYRKQKGVEIFLPLVHQESFKAVKYRLPLTKNTFDIYEPSDSLFYIKSSKIDCALIPVLGVDRAFRRIGFGKGMYDRFFSADSNKLPKIIFICRKFNFTTKIITQDYDIKGDYYLTPSKLIKSTFSLSNLSKRKAHKCFYKTKSFKVIQ